MVRGKRTYIPKVKGCYECSQRRIHCDRNQPNCIKCTTKGIRCSGLGVRYRFRDDVKEQDDVQIGKSVKKLQSDHDEDTNLIEDENDLMISNITITPSEQFESWKQYFLNHFSQHIASEMVVIDDNSNGWRHLILPIAYADDLVREAVVAASVFHFSTNRQTQLFDAITTYTSAVRKLHQRQDLQQYDLTGKQTVLLALLVLLTAAIVQGSSEFITIFRLIESALLAIGGEDVVMNGELGLFLVRQIRKYRGYVSPYISQSEGLTRLSLTTLYGLEVANGWECFKSYYNKHPELADQMIRLSSIQKQACDIYVARATAEGDFDQSDAVGIFVEELKLIPPGSIGEHTLVFPTFLVALESTLPEHQAYFEYVLDRHYQRNGFSNIAVGLKYLREVWARKDGSNWTQYLPTIKQFIV